MSETGTDPDHRHSPAKHRYNLLDVSALVELLWVMRAAALIRPEISTQKR
jgi:hypothetical protein